MTQRHIRNSAGVGESRSCRTPDLRCSGIHVAELYCTEHRRFGANRDGVAFLAHACAAAASTMVSAAFCLLYRVGAAGSATTFVVGRWLEETVAEAKDASAFLSIQGHRARACRTSRRTSRFSRYSARSSSPSCVCFYSPLRPWATGESGMLGSRLDEGLRAPGNGPAPRCCYVAGTTARRRCSSQHTCCTRYSPVGPKDTRVMRMQGARVYEARASWVSAVPAMHIACACHAYCLCLPCVMRIACAQHAVLACSSTASVVCAVRQMHQLSCTRATFLRPVYPQPDAYAGRGGANVDHVLHVAITCELRIAMPADRRNTPYQ
jgi:hypothetical protein